MIDYQNMLSYFLITTKSIIGSPAYLLHMFSFRPSYYENDLEYLNMKLTDEIDYSKGEFIKFTEDDFDKRFSNFCLLNDENFSRRFSKFLSPENRQKIKESDPTKLDELKKEINTELFNYQPVRYLVGENHAPAFCVGSILAVLGFRRYKSSSFLSKISSRLRPTAPILFPFIFYNAFIFTYKADTQPPYTVRYFSNPNDPRSARAKSIRRSIIDEL